ncbi:hypothetical protein D7231_35990 [Streptomyces klenkii]|uniref:Uncharacterized protein n=1 Tax=Streptomyces klenkii TaxID=1420899 RepID=A0A3A9ZQZ0_9ACTN|nr:hypothetical protein [Streptomyces klenkii]RKN49877.1 hypothetical protein D7231_35990 [Streptomyces klenkii]
MSGSSESSEAPKKGPKRGESSQGRATDPADQPTPDRLLHTGAERPLDPEDLVRLSGREPTPERVEKARKLLEEEGPAAAERYLP